MTDKALNKAIATKLGWKDIPPIPGREHLFDGYMLKPDAKSEHDIEKAPDFCGSLDAMAIAERWLRYLPNGRWKHEEEQTYLLLLSEDGECAQCAFASSKDRANAFAYATGILPVAGKEEV